MAPFLVLLLLTGPLLILLEGPYGTWVVAGVFLLPIAVAAKRL